MFGSYKWHVNLNDIQDISHAEFGYYINAMSMPESTLVKIFNRSFLLNSLRT